MSDRVRSSPARPLTVTDVVCGIPVLVLAVVATCSLALAHAGRHSLPAVLATSAALLAALAVPARRIRPRADHAGLAAVLGCGLLAAVMFVPGFSYGVGDKDPGNQVAHAVQIAREGSYAFTDPALAHPALPVATNPSGHRLPAIWVDDAESGRIVPQFFHLWPALLATSYDIAGHGGLTTTAPLVGVVAVLLVAATLRRLGGVAAALVGGVLLATTMPQVWQAKTPSSEMLAQALFAGATFAVVVAAQERWRPAAAVAGLLVGVAYLNRVDALLLVLLATATLAASWASLRADGEVASGAGGLAIVLPYALWQAYGPGRAYSAENGAPGLVQTLAVIAALATAGAALRLRLRRPLVPSVAAQRRAGLAAVAVTVLLLVAGFLRPLVADRTVDVVLGVPRRSYDELNLHRLSWFLTVPAFGLAALGVAVSVLRRGRAQAWAVVLPVLLIAPVYVYDARVGSQLMWWTRRYVPTVLPGLVMLVALALAFCLAWESRWRRALRALAVAVAVALAAGYLHQSARLRGHDEWAGSFTVSARLSALAGDARGVYLWHQPAPETVGGATLWAVPVWLAHGELSVLLPIDPAEVVDYVRRYRNAFPGDPLFVVWDGAAPSSIAEPLGLVAVDRVVGALPKWDESNDEPPMAAHTEPYDLAVYRVP